MTRNIDLALLAAKKAGQLLLKHTPTTPLSPEQRNQLMDDADRQVHDCIYDTLYEACPDYEYISVFTQNQTFFTEGPLWVIDPIVGLGNFGHGNPHYALSIALNIDDVTRLGVIYNPAFDELFTSVRDEGAYLNDTPIEVSDTGTVKESLLATRFPYDLSENDQTTLKIYNEVILKSEGVLNHATATLDLAYVAAGRVDGFWAKGMNPWDLTAAALLIKEAGGKVTTLTGNEYFTEGKDILATNGAIHYEMINVITENITQDLK